MNHYFFSDDKSTYLVQRTDAGRLRWYGVPGNWSVPNVGGIINADPQNVGALPLPNPILHCAHVFAGGAGVIYAVQLSTDLAKNGQLVCYQDTLRDGSPGSLGAPVKIGAGWDGFAYLFSCGNGRIYAMNAKGELYFYRHAGAGQWPVQYQLIGSGWNIFSHIFSGGTFLGASGKNEAVIYAIDTKGQLWWYKHLDADGGAMSWAGSGVGVVIGTGWDRCTGAFSDGNGTIYSVDLDGAIRRSVVSNYKDGPPANSSRLIQVQGVDPEYAS